MSAPHAVEEDRRALAAYRLALRRELHTLARDPALMWQQLYNRLQWEADEVPARLASQLASRLTPGAPLWLHQRTPLRESAGLIRTLGGGGAIRSLAVAPDASFVAVAQLNAEHVPRPGLGPGPEDHTLRLYDTETGRVIAEVPGVWAVRRTADGALYLDGQSWRDIRTGEAVPDGLPVPGRSLRVTVRKYGKSLALRDARTGKSVRTLSGSTSDIEDYAVSPEGSFIVSASGRTLKVWDTDRGAVVTSLRAAGRAVYNCAISPDARLIAGGVDIGVRVYDAADFSEVLRVGEELASSIGPRPCAFSPDGRKLASADSGYVVRVWDLATGEAEITFEGHSGTITGCAFSPDGSFLASASADGTLRLWDLGSGGAGASQARAPLSVRGLPAERSFAERVWSRRGAGFTLRSIETGEDLPRQSFRAACWEQPEQSVCTYAPPAKQGQDRYTLEIWDADAGDRRFSLRLPQPALGMPFGVGIGPGGFNVATFGGLASRMAALWDARSGRLMRVLRGTKRVVQGTIAPDASQVLSQHEDGSIALWDVASGRVRSEFTPYASDRRWHDRLCLSPDGTLGATAEDGRYGVAAPVGIRIWDTYGRVLHTLNGHVGQVRGCAFSPDDRLLFSVGEDKTLRVWDVRSASLLARLPLSTAPFGLVAHPSEPLVACGSGRTSTQVLELTNIDYGPLHVTVHESPDGLTVRCPACHARSGVERSSLGHVVTCPRSDCARPLSVDRRVMLVWGDLPGAEALTPQPSDCDAVRTAVRDVLKAVRARDDRLALKHDRETLGLALLGIEAAEEEAHRRLLTDAAIIHLIACERCSEDPAGWLGSGRARRGGAQVPGKRDTGGAAGGSGAAGGRRATAGGKAAPRGGKKVRSGNGKKTPGQKRGGFFGRLFGGGSER